MRLGVVGIIAVAFLALEMVGMYRIAQSIGAAPTGLWLIAAVIAGVWVIRRAGAGFLPGLATSLERGHAPFGVIWTTNPSSVEAHESDMGPEPSPPTSAQDASIEPF